MRKCRFVKAYAKGVTYIPAFSMGVIAEEDEKYYWVNVNWHDRLMVPKDYVVEVY